MSCFHEFVVCQLQCSFALEASLSTFLPSFNSAVLLFFPSRPMQERMDILMKKAKFGDWFIIFLISKNLDSVIFKEFILQLTDKLKTDA